MKPVKAFSSFFVALLHVPPGYLTMTCVYRVHSWCFIKTHGSVSCRPRKWGACKRNEFIDRNNKVAIFTHLFLCDYPSKWHQIYSGISLHPGEATFQIWRRSLKPFQRYESANFLVFFLLFPLCKNHYSLRMCASIWLKFNTHIGSLKANTSINFGVNLFNILGVISDFTHRTKLNFYQAYRLNRFKEQAENWYVARLNIRGVPFDG